jgi:predicted ATPase/DNA-binding winged helix-turn-helix (wHTH) protein
MKANEAGEPGFRINQEFLLLPKQRRLLRDGKPLAMTPFAMGVLVYLVEHRDRPVSRQEIMDVLWPPHIHVEQNNVSTYVWQLRGVFGQRSITTIRTTTRGNDGGYQFAAEVEALRDMAPDLVRPETNLWQRWAGLTGRERELAEGVDRLERNPLVTLVGPAGIGKTRLAAALGWQAMTRFYGGVWLVDLAPLSDRASIISALAAVLAIPLRGVEAPLAALAAAIGAQPVLLIFDNCDRLIGPAGALIAELLELAPGLSVLVTSREELRLPDEQVYRVNALALPPKGSADAAEIAGFGAIALFDDRARAGDDRFRLTDDNAAIVTEICRSLDGVPMALEMAAAQVPLLGLEGLRAQLDKRLKLFSTRAQTPDRRRVRFSETLDWSHDLLDAEQQRLFRRLGVFPASFTAEAAIAIAGEDGADPAESLDGLSLLVAKSLVMVEHGKAPRHRLLETQRLYALDKLKASGEYAAMADRHLRYFIDFFGCADAAWETIPDAEGLAIYRPEIDNFRAGLDWALAAPGRIGAAIALAGSVGHVWDRLDLLPDGPGNLDRLVEGIDQETPQGDAARLLQHAGTQWRSADRLRSLEVLERAAALYRQLGDRQELGSVLGQIGGNYVFLGRYAEAKATLDDALQILHGTNRTKSVIAVRNNVGTLALLRNDLDEARRSYATVRTLARVLKDVLRENIALSNLAEVEFRLGATDRAIDCGDEAAKGLRSINAGPYLAWVLVNLAGYLILCGYHAEARAYAEEAFALLREKGGAWLRLDLLQLALLGTFEGRCAAAAQIRGFVDASYARTGEIRQPLARQLSELLSTRLAAELAPGDLDAWAGDGGRWSEDLAIDFALSHLVSSEAAAEP